MRTHFILSIAFLLSFPAGALAQTVKPNNILKGKILFQSSGNKPAVGVRIAEPDANPVYSVDNGDYVLTFQQKRDGAALALEVGMDDRNRQKLELVNEKEVKNATLPADPGNILEIIVCPAGQRDIAAQRYYRILRTTADRELEKKKKEVDELLAQNEKDYQKISDLSALIERMQQEIDSARIRAQAFDIASVNLDKASELVKAAIKKLDDEQDAEGALAILNAKSLDDAYLQASEKKKSAEAEIKQVIQAYELKIQVLKSKFLFQDIISCYDKIIAIYLENGFDEMALVDYYEKLSNAYYKNGNYDQAIQQRLKAIVLLEKNVGPEDIKLLASYNFAGVLYRWNMDFPKASEYFMKALVIKEKVLDPKDPSLAISYDDIGDFFSEIGNYEMAIKYLNKSLVISEEVLDSNDFDLGLLYHHISQYYWRVKNYSKALEFSIKNKKIAETMLLPNDPNLGSIYGFIGTIYFTMDSLDMALYFHEKSLFILEKVLPLEHTDRLAGYSNISQTYLAIGNHKKAIQYALKAVETGAATMKSNNTNLGRFYLNLGAVYYHMNDYDNSLINYQKALDVFLQAPIVDSLRAQYRISVTLAHRGLKKMNEKNFGTAVDDFNKVLASKELKNIYAYRGRCHYALKNYPSAISDLLRAIALDTTHDKFRYRDTLGMAYAKNKQFKKAKEVFSTIEESHPQNAQTFRNWAMYYALQKKRKKALENLQKAVALGYNDLEWITTDDSLQSIRGEQGYKDVVEQLK